MHSSGFLKALPPKQNFLASTKVYMRSDIVFNALQTKNRFELCHEAFKAVRRLHKAKTRIADTTNDALARLAGINPPEAVIMPGEIEP
jgi:hypothetical protein